MSTEDTTGVDDRLATPVAQYGEDGGTKRALGNYGCVIHSFIFVTVNASAL